MSVFTPKRLSPQLRQPSTTRVMMLDMLVALTPALGMAVFFFGVRVLALPEAWYRGFFTAFLGFPGPGFRSADYFSLLPWLFLFWTGWFLYTLRPQEGRRERRLPLAADLGRHSLLVYLLHQPAIYGALWLFAR